MADSSSTAPISLAEAPPLTLTPDDAAAPAAAAGSSPQPPQPPPAGAASSLAATRADVLRRTGIDARPWSQLSEAERAERTRLFVAYLAVYVLIGGLLAFAWLMTFVELQVVVAFVFFALYTAYCVYIAVYLYVKPESAIRPLTKDAITSCLLAVVLPFAVTLFVLGFAAPHIDQQLPAPWSVSYAAFNVSAYPPAPGAEEDCQWSARLQGALQRPQQWMCATATVEMQPYGCWEAALECAPYVYPEAPFRVYDLGVHKTDALDPVGTHQWVLHAAVGNTSTVAYAGACSVRCGLLSPAHTVAPLRLAPAEGDVDELGFWDATHWTPLYTGLYVMCVVMFVGTTCGFCFVARRCRQVREQIGAQGHGLVHDPRANADAHQPAPAAAAAADDTPSAHTALQTDSLALNAAAAVDARDTSDMELTVR